MITMAGVTFHAIPSGPMKTGAPPTISSGEEFQALTACLSVFAPKTALTGSQAGRLNANPPGSMSETFHALMHSMHR